MCLGRGDNGKTTLLSLFLRLFKEYAVLLQIDTWMVRQESNNMQADLADLRGARFVMTSEKQQGQQLAEGKLKRITQDGLERIRLCAGPGDGRLVTGQVISAVRGLGVGDQCRWASAGERSGGMPGRCSQLGLDGLQSSDGPLLLHGARRMRCAEDGIPRSNRPAIPAGGQRGSRGGRYYLR